VSLQRLLSLLSLRQPLATFHPANFVALLTHLNQAIKLVDFFRCLFIDGQNGRYALKWLFVDFLYCTVLSALRIPRLDYAKSVVLIHILTLWLVDGFMFGIVSVNLGSGGTSSIIPSIRFTSECHICVFSPRLTVQRARRCGFHSTEV
jgi:hypothetical protein